MTDGIIQNVFKKFKQEYFFSPSILIHIEKHEQELIAEIKKQRNTWMGNMSRMEIELFTKELIGDNQE